MNLSVKKDGKNPHFKNEYITLDKLVSKLQPICNDLNLLVTHNTFNNQVVTVVYNIESDDIADCVSSSFVLGDMSNPQKVGSAITYAKRYNLCQIFNIISDRDDDGNKASEKPEFNKSVFDIFCQTYKTYGSADEALKKIKTKYVIDYDWETKVLALYD